MMSLKDEILMECVKYAKENNESDLEKVMEIVMKKRLAFYDEFQNDFDSNVTKIDKALSKGI